MLTSLSYKTSPSLQSVRFFFKLSLSLSTIKIVNYSILIFAYWIACLIYSPLFGFSHYSYKKNSNKKRKNSYSIPTKWALPFIIILAISKTLNVSYIV